MEALIARKRCTALDRNNAMQATVGKINSACSLLHDDKTPLQMEEPTFKLADAPSPKPSISTHKLCKLEPNPQLHTKASEPET